MSALLQQAFRTAASELGMASAAWLPLTGEKTAARRRRLPMTICLKKVFMFDIFYSRFCRPCRERRDRPVARLCSKTCAIGRVLGYLALKTWFLFFCCLAIREQAWLNSAKLGGIGPGDGGESSGMTTQMQRCQVLTIRQGRGRADRRGAGPSSAPREDSAFCPDRSPRGAQDPGHS